jgi:hypothetical protein
MRRALEGNAPRRGSFDGFNSLIKLARIDVTYELQSQVNLGFGNKLVSASNV